MAESMIKKKIKKLLDNEENIYFFGPDAIPTINSDFLMDFARLICEEMTGKMIIPAETFGEQGYNVRVAENEVKAQEILKALE